MAVIKLGQMIHKSAVGPVTSANPLDTEDVNSMAILTALGLVSTESTLLQVKTAVESLDGKDFATQTTLSGIKTLLESAIVEEGTAL